MSLEPLLEPAVGIAAVIAVVFVFTAYTMAEGGLLNDTHFGRAVFIAIVLVSGVAVLQEVLGADLPRTLGMGTDDVAFFAISFIFLAGACGAILDTLTWLVRKLRGQ